MLIIKFLRFLKAILQLFFLIEFLIEKVISSTIGIHFWCSQNHDDVDKIAICIKASHISHIQFSLYSDRNLRNKSQKNRTKFSYIGRNTVSEITLGGQNF